MWLDSERSSLGISFAINLGRPGFICLAVGRVWRISMRTLEDFYPSRYLEMIQEAYREVLPMGVLFENELEGHSLASGIIGEMKILERHRDQRQRRRHFSDDKSRSCACLNKPDDVPCSRSDRQAAMLAALVHRKLDGHPCTVLYRCRSGMSGVVIPIFIPKFPVLGVVGYLYGGQFFALGNDQDYLASDPDPTGADVSSFHRYVYKVSDKPRLRDGDIGKSVLEPFAPDEYIHDGFCYDQGANVREWCRVGLSPEKAEITRLLDEHHDLWNEDVKTRKESVDHVKTGIAALEHIVRELFIEYDDRMPEKLGKLAGLLQQAKVLGQKLKTDGYIALMNHAAILEDLGNYSDAKESLEQAQALAESAGDRIATEYLRDRLRYAERLANTSTSTNGYLVRALLDVYDLFNRPETRHSSPDTSRDIRLFGIMQENLAEKERLLKSDRTITADTPNSLLVLQRWNSFTPLLPSTSSPGKGGGMFLHWNGKGIVIDPGVDFLKNFFAHGFSVADIDAIICTHAHDDHTAEVEGILSLVYGRRHKAKKSDQTIQLVFNQGTTRKFAGWINLKEPYISSWITLTPDGNGSWHSLSDSIRILPTRAFHDEKLSTKYPMGLVFDLTDSAGQAVRLWYTGDTGFFNRDDDARSDPERVSDQIKDLMPIDLMIANIGSVREEEFLPLTHPDGVDSLSPRFFYNHHLGLNGILSVVREVRPTTTIVTEFGEEFSSFRRDIVEILREQTGETMLAGDIGLKVLWPHGDIGNPLVRCLRPDGEYDTAAGGRKDADTDRAVFYSPPSGVVSMHAKDDGGLAYTSRGVQIKCQVLRDLCGKDIWNLSEDDHKFFPQGIKGWQYPEATVEAANKSGQLLTMDFDLEVGCNLQCKYCFVDGDAREESVATEDRLSTDELMKLFGAAKDLGLRSAKLVGRGEPFLQRDILDLLKFCTKNDIWIVVFTNASVLGDDHLCQEIHDMSAVELIRQLKDLKVSIMVKLHSLDPEVEDNLVGARQPYSVVRNRALLRLIDEGFNEGCPGDDVATTRLGIENVLVRPALQDVEEIYRLTFTRNLFIDIDPPVPVGLTSDADKRRASGLEVSPEDCLRVATRLYQMNKRYVEDYQTLFRGASPYFGGLPCTQLPNGLYVNSLGRIYPCCGCNRERQMLGNIRDNPDMTEALRNAMEKNPYRTRWRDSGIAYPKSVHGESVFHGCTYRDFSKIMKPGWERAIKRRLQY
jgi:uncharacterized Fe-S cluster-containing radical SAM superfamily protein